MTPRARLGAGCGLLIVALSARAGPLSAALRLEVPEADRPLACPSGADLGARVAALLGPNAPALAGDRRVIVRFARSPAGYTARISLPGAPTNERELTEASPDCAALSDAVGLAVAMMLDASPPAAPPASSAPRATWTRRSS